jgi:hypothetical protein
VIYPSDTSDGATRHLVFAMATSPNWDSRQNFWQASLLSVPAAIMEAGPGRKIDFFVRGDKDASVMELSHARLGSRRSLSLRGKDGRDAGH